MKPIEKAAEIAGLSKKEFILMTKFSPVPYAEELMKFFDFICDKNQRLWLYDREEGIWEMNVEQKIKSILRKNLMGDEQQKKNYIEEIVTHIKDISYNEDFEMNKFKHLIPFKNKVYNLKTDKFIEFSSQLFLTNKLNIEIDEAITDCPTIDKFFEDCIGEDFKCLLYDLCAYCLYKEYPYQKLFFIYGAANTGKSKFMDFMEVFLGTENRCSVEPQHIEKDQYSVQRMMGKLANISSDIRYDALNDITVVKKLTGGDTMRVREMYRNPYDAKLYCKQIFSTNKLPVVKEKTNAWYRRVFLLPFENIVPEEKVDRNLLKKLIEPKELQGFAYMCLRHLRELYENDFVFSYDIDEREMQKMYEELSNPILMFINENCEKGSEQFCFKWEFAERLNAWLKDRHFPPYTKSQINQYMNENYNESNRQSGMGDKVYRVWIGFKWRSLTSLNGFNHFNGVSKKVYISKRSYKTPLNPLKPLSSTNPSEIKESEHKKLQDLKKNPVIY